MRTAVDTPCPTPPPSRAAAPVVSKATPRYRRMRKLRRSSHTARKGYAVARTHGATVPRRSRGRRDRPHGHARAVAETRARPCARQASTVRRFRAPGPSKPNASTVAQRETIRLGTGALVLKKRRDQISLFACHLFLRVAFLSFRVGLLSTPASAPPAGSHLSPYCFLLLVIVRILNLLIAVFLLLYVSSEVSWRGREAEINTGDKKNSTPGPRGIF